MELTIGEEKYIPYAIDKGIYRCIVAPTATDAALSVEGLFYDGDAPVTFSKDGIELASGNYKRLKVNYTYEGYNRIRPITNGKSMRMSYQRQKEVLEMPNLIEVQKDSYNWFLEEGLKEVFADISPITDYSGKLSLEFVDLLCARMM